MDDHEPSSFSLGDSLRRIAHTFLRAVQNRIDLFAIELQEEKQWMLATILWAFAAMFFCGLAIIFVAVTVVWVVPERAQPWVLVGFSAIFVCLAVTAVNSLRRLLREKPPAFGESVAELKKDFEWIRSQD